MDTKKQKKYVPREMIQITINGIVQSVGSFSKASYEWLCEQAGIDPARQPTITFRVPVVDSGPNNGTVTRGWFAPMCDGAVYNVAVTGNA